MQTFHITFSREGDFYAGGVNIKDKSIIKAIQRFEKEYPDCLIECVCRKDL
jgi:hypothetical protein